MSEPVALLALGLDAAFGWPGWLYARIGHPVGGFAHIIQWGESRWNREGRSSVARRRAGIALVLLLLVTAGGGAWLMERAIRDASGGWAWFWLGLVAWPALAQHSLYAHVMPVARALASGDLDGARRAVGWIVGRDTQDLDEAGVARAGIESLAESFCDGVVAPLFWLLLLGLPGAWAYKAINTADSLIGHKEPPFTDFGWAAARLDDLLNWVPARLSGIALCLAGAGGWPILWRDHKRHASPNAGWPEAAMAGALGIRLAGPIRYDGIMHAKPWIGEGGEADAGKMLRAVRIYLLGCGIFWALALGIWGLGG